MNRELLFQVDVIERKAKGKENVVQVRACLSACLVL